MNDCRGKNLALFYHLRQHRCGCFLLFFCYFFHSEESPGVSSIVLFLDMTPVGRAPQTKHWAAPALTHGESRGWLQWIKSWTPLPLPKTTRRYRNKTVLKMKKKISITCLDCFNWSLKNCHCFLKVELFQGFVVFLNYKIVCYLVFRCMQKLWMRTRDSSPGCRTANKNWPR